MEAECTVCVCAQVCACVCLLFSMHPVSSLCCEPQIEKKKVQASSFQAVYVEEKGVKVRHKMGIRFKRVHL